MGTRIELHNELLTFVPNAYFQPPTGLQMKYPCIVYDKSGKDVTYANNKKYKSIQMYDLTLIERDPDTDIADRIFNHFDYCDITQYYVTENLSHTKLNLYY